MACVVQQETRAKTVLEIASIHLAQHKARQELKLATEGFHETEGRAMVPLRAAIRRAEELGVSEEYLSPARAAVAEDERRSQVVAAELVAATAGDNPDLLRAALRRCMEVSGSEPDGVLEKRMLRARGALRKMIALQRAAPIKSVDPKPTESLRESAKRARPLEHEDRNPRPKKETERPAAELEPERKPSGCGLRVEPGRMICFGASPSSEEQTIRPLRLVNDSDSRVAFKVKLTFREFYLVRPRCCGTLRPGESRDLQVSLAPSWQEMGPGKRRLVVHEMPVGPAEEVPRSAWNYMRERTREHRLRVFIGAQTSSSSSRSSRSRSSSACGFAPADLD